MLLAEVFNYSQNFQVQVYEYNFKVNLFQVIQLNDLPLVVSFIGNQKCNTGHVLSLKQQLQPLLSELKGTVVEP